jgi:hypothetical protein
LCFFKQGNDGVEPLLNKSERDGLTKTDLRQIKANRERKVRFLQQRKGSILQCIDAAEPLCEVMCGVTSDVSHCCGTRQANKVLPAPQVDALVYFAWCFTTSRHGPMQGST